MRLDAEGGGVPELEVTGSLPGEHRSHWGTAPLPTVYGPTPQPGDTPLAEGGAAASLPTAYGAVAAPVDCDSLLALAGSCSQTLPPGFGPMSAPRGGRCMLTPSGFYEGTATGSVPAPADGAPGQAALFPLPVVYGPVLEAGGYGPVSAAGALSPELIEGLDALGLGTFWRSQEPSAQGLSPTRREPPNSWGSTGSLSIPGSLSPQEEAGFPHLALDRLLAEDPFDGGRAPCKCPGSVADSDASRNFGATDIDVLAARLERIKVQMETVELQGEALLKAAMAVHAEWRYAGTSTEASSSPERERGEGPGHVCGFPGQPQPPEQQPVRAAEPLDKSWHRSPSPLPPELDRKLPSLGAGPAAHARREQLVVSEPVRDSFGRQGQRPVPPPPATGVAAATPYPIEVA